MSANWVMRPRPRPQAAARLFCFPWAGGGASAYTPWAELLPDSIELCAIQLPGRENRVSERSFERLSALADTLAAAIADELTRPFAFFGHSMGGLVAFELARRVSVAGGGPAHLFVAGCGAPQFRRLRRPLHRLPDGALLEAVRRLDGLPEWVLKEPELLALVVPTLRVDLRMFETYQYNIGGRLPCAITAFGGMQDGAVLPMEVAGWEHQTTGRFRLRLLPGSHFFVWPQRQTIIDTISAALSPTAT